jgi:hypothetical protein
MLIRDGGGKVPNSAKPMEGGRRIAELFYASSLRHGSGLGVKLMLLNGHGRCCALSKANSNRHSRSQRTGTHYSYRCAAQP